MDFQFEYIHKKDCLTCFMYSKTLNQIVIIKFPNRKHYISKKIAQGYLQSNRKIIENKLGKSLCRDVYILNILISNRLTNNTFELISSNNKNMDMVFKPNKKTTNEKILSAILKALTTKCKSWHDKIKTRCKQPHSKFVNTLQGSYQVDKTIRPYGAVLEKIKVLENASNFLEFSYKKLERGGS